MKGIIIAALFAIVIFGGFLRFNQISTNPPGLYLDEAAIGLNAYDILKSGRDEYGTFLPLTFRSFDDYKMPGYIYLTTVSMAIFGKNEFAIRFPSALAGTATIIVIFLLLEILLDFHTSTKKYKDIFSLVGALLLAILPWHLLISRGGYEVTVALFLYLLGLVCALAFWKQGKIWLLISSVVLCAFAMYTYHSYRIISPLTILAGIGVLWRNKKKREEAVAAALLFFLLSLPLFIFSITPDGASRFTQTSAFGDDPFIGITRIPINFFIYVKNYYSYYSLTYLFSYGDQINRHQVNNFGLLYIWQLPYLIAGLYFLTKTPNKMLRFIILFLLLVGPIPAAFARPSPHSLRFLLGTIGFTLLTVAGIYQLCMQKRKVLKKIIIFMTIVIACIEFSYYTHFYYVQYPKLAIIDWGGGCKAVAQKIYELRQDYTKIYVDKNVGCVSEYFAFYIPDVHIQYLSPNQTVSSSNGKALYVRPYYGSNSSTHLVYTYRLPVLNKTVFAEFWQL